MTSNLSLKMGLRRKPYAFTENGVAMLSSVLSSKKSIKVNISIMRTFTKLHRMMHEYTDLKRKIEKMELKYDSQFKSVFEAIKYLIEPPDKPKKQIGFVTANKYLLL